MSLHDLPNVLYDHAIVPTTSLYGMPRGTLLVVPHGPYGSHVI
jgi:hypothetical protein